MFDGKKLSSFGATDGQNLTRAGKRVGISCWLRQRRRRRRRRLDLACVRGRASLQTALCLLVAGGFHLVAAGQTNRVDSNERLAGGGHALNKSEHRAVSSQQQRQLQWGAQSEAKWRRNCVKVTAARRTNGQTDDQRPTGQAARGKQTARRRVQGSERARGEFRPPARVYQAF